MNVQLFEGERVRLAPHDPDKDAEVESGWTHDPEYMRLVSADLVRPLSPGQIKKKYEEAGFVVEGRVRQCLNRDGRRWDMLCMGILKEETT